MVASCVPGSYGNWLLATGLGTPGGGKRAALGSLCLLLGAAMAYLASYLLVGQVLKGS